MLRYLLLASCMVLGSLPGLGQHTAGLRSAQLRTGILSLLDPYNPGLELSAERKLDAKTSVQLSLAYLHDFLGTTPYKDFSGARAAVAKKWAFPARRRHRLYRALEFGVSVAGYGTEGRFAIPNADGSVNLFYRHYYESFTVQKQTAFAGGRVGIQGAFGQFVYDASVGGGVKYKRTQHVGRRYPGGILFPGFIKLDPYQFADKEMKGLTGNLPVSVSIGYTF